MHLCKLYTRNLLNVIVCVCLCVWSVYVCVCEWCRCIRKPKVALAITFITFHLIYWWGLSLEPRHFGFSFSNQLAWSIQGARVLNSRHHIWWTVLYPLSQLPKPLKSYWWHCYPSFIIHQLHKTTMVASCGIWSLASCQPLSPDQSLHIHHTILGLSSSQNYV